MTSPRLVHDPLCLAQHPNFVSPQSCTWCDLIDKVQAREGDRYRAGVEDSITLFGSLDRLQLSRSERYVIAEALKSLLSDE